MSLYSAILLAIGIVVMMRKARYNYERLPRIAYAAGARMPEVAVIIPAPEGEAELAAEGFPDGSVIFVGGAGGGEVEARRVAAPPAPGSYCAAGAAAAGETEWLLFVEADARCARVLLPSLVAYAGEEGLEMVSVLLREEPRTLGERVLGPWLEALRYTGVSAARVNGRPPSQWLGGGHCLLVKRNAYEAMGGHGAGVGTEIDTRELWKAAGAKGIRMRVARAESFGSSAGGPGAWPMDTGMQIRAGLSAALFWCWLPVLAWLASAGLYRQAAIFAFIPSLILLPWYRGPAALLAPAAIYLSLPAVLRLLRGDGK